MKLVAMLLILLVIGLFWFGTPFSEQPELANHYGAPEPILPMTFAHQDHTATQCVACHHNYVDDTGMETCMTCHVTNAEVWPLFEEQFHALCRDCHVNEHIAGKESGPVRSCIGCHLSDEKP